MNLPVEFKFMPTRVFEWWREFPDGERRLIGQYHPGMTYNCTKEPVHDALREKCKGWAQAKDIVIIPLNPGEFFKRLQVREND